MFPLLYSSTEFRHNLLLLNPRKDISCLDESHTHTFVINTPLPLSTFNSALIHFFLDIHLDNDTSSVVDNETQIPSNDGSMIPVFNQPIYAPFGLDARRCSGEIFNQFVIFELFKAVQCLNFYDDCKLNPTRCNPLSLDYIYTPVALAPFKAAPDSLFVSGNPTCAYPVTCA